MRRPGLRRLTVFGGAVALLSGTAFTGAAEAAHLGCGSVITANTTLDADIGPCAGDGIIIGADNITLNLNGHHIFGTPGPGDGNQAGVRAPFRTGVSVVGNRRGSLPAGTIRDFDAGVFINGGGSNRIRDLVVRDNIGPLDSNALLGDGIAVFHSSDNSITGNVVTNNGRFDGIGIYGLGSNNNEIRRNRVEDNIGISEAESPEVGPGVVPHYINASGHGIIVSHFLDQPLGTDEGIYDNLVMNNTVRRNQGSGISTVANINGVIVGNVVEDNAAFYYGNFYRLQGFYAPSSVIGIGVTTGPGMNATPTNVLVSNNVVNRNGIIGIHIDTSGNRIRDNQVFDNGAWGISIYFNALNNEILHNRTGGNLMVDLVDQSGEDPPCATNRWWDNTHSAEVKPLGIEFGLTNPYEPACTAAGP